MGGVNCGLLVYVISWRGAGTRRRTVMGAAGLVYTGLS